MARGDNHLTLKRIAGELAGIYQEDMSTAEKNITDHLMEAGYLRWSEGIHPKQAESTME